MIKLFKAYGIYKKVRNAAWKVLIDNEISSLPVDLSKIAQNNEITILKNSDVGELREGEDGISIFDGENWFIVYDDTLESIGYKRLVIAHELGHIFLGHPLYSGIHSQVATAGKPKEEIEADTFAGRLLAPACVLWGLNLHITEDIANVCKISKKAAQARAQRMKILYERNVFLTDPLEKKLYKQFESFLKEFRN